MDMTETLATEKEAIKNGHDRDTGKKKRQSRMDMTETLATEKEAIKNGHYRDSGNRKRGNQEWTLQSDNFDTRKSKLFHWKVFYNIHVIYR
jgi:hypothetical protein